MLIRVNSVVISRRDPPVKCKLDPALRMLMASSHGGKIIREAVSAFVQNGMRFPARIAQGSRAQLYMFSASASATGSPLLHIHAENVGRR